MQKKLPEDSIFRKKGFFAALYACVGVVLVLGAVVSYNNWNTLKTPQTSERPANEANASLISAKPEIGQAQSTMLPADPDAPQAAGGPPAALQNAAEGVDHIIAEQQAASVTSEPQDMKKGADSQPKSPEQPAAGTSAEPSSASAKPSIVPEKSSKDGNHEPAAPAFEAFKEGDKMDWPVSPLEGGILKPYSMDHVKYDKTLDLYKVNDNICIGANVGMPVKAASAGVVIKVEKNSHENGNSITIDNGNGWITTYGQLQDHMLVEEGDVVKKDETIGGVGSPSMYSILLGSHVSFKVEKDSEPVDPMSVLAEMN